MNFEMIYDKLIYHTLFGGFDHICLLFFFFFFLAFFPPLFQRRRQL
jgi:hypothetical protein